MARLVLTQPGECFKVGGTITLVGTTAGEDAFDGVSRSLLYDGTGSEKLSSQVNTTNETGVGVTSQRLGSEAANVINGTAAADVIDGLSGNDTINGLGGDDVIRGGGGNDTIDGGAGEDTIYGGEGNDRIIDNEGDYGEYYGDAGDDYISVNNLAMTSAKIAGGNGDDLIDLTFGKIGFAMVDAGSGNDRIVVNSQGMETSLLLGEGRDEVVLPVDSLTHNGIGLTIVRDFEVGADGDKLTFADALNNYLQNYKIGSNPFASGHLKLIDFYGNAYLQVDRDGSEGSAAPQNLVNFAGVDLDTLTAENLGGFDASTGSALAQLSFRRAAFAEPDPISHFQTTAHAEQPVIVTDEVLSPHPQTTLRAEHLEEVQSLHTLGLFKYDESHYFLV